MLLPAKEKEKELSTLCRCAVLFFGAAGRIKVYTLMFASPSSDTY